MYGRPVVVKQTDYFHFSVYWAATASFLVTLSTIPDDVLRVARYRYMPLGTRCPAESQRSHRTLIIASEVELIEVECVQSRRPLRSNTSSTHSEPGSGISVVKVNVTPDFAGLASVDRLEMTGFAWAATVKLREAEEKLPALSHTVRSRV